MIYRQCNICKKIFKKKSHYEQHVYKKKKPCNEKNDDIYREEKQNIQEIKLEDNVDLYTKLIIDKDKKNKELEDKYKELERKNLELEETNKKLKDKTIKILEENKKITNKILTTKKSLIIQENREIKSENIIQGDVNINNNINNINNQNLNQNLLVVAFGKENLTDIFKDSTKMADIIKKGYGSVEAFIKEIHFNENHPERHNVTINSDKDSKARIFNGNKWLTKNRADVVDNLIDRKISILQNQLDNNDEINNKLLDIAKERFHDFVKDNEDYNNDEADKEAMNKMKNIRQKIGNLLIDNKDLVKKTIKNQKIKLIN